MNDCYLLILSSFHVSFHHNISKKKDILCMILNEFHYYQLQHIVSDPLHRKFSLNQVTNLHSNGGILFLGEWITGILFYLVAATTFWVKISPFCKVNYFFLLQVIFIFYFFILCIKNKLSIANYSIGQYYVIVVDVKDML